MIPALSSRYEPVSITCAVSGGDVFKSQSPHIPCGPDEIVAEALAAAEAGAAAVHLHAREPVSGKPTGSPSMFAEIASGIRERSDVVIGFTTGGTPGMSQSERFGSLEAGRPEIASFNLGTMNYEGWPNPERWPAVEHDWEREALAASGTIVMTNTLAMMRDLAALCRDLGITPELEAYDLSHIWMARQLLEEGTLEAPVRIQFVLGVLGGASHALEELVHMRETTDRALGEAVGSVSVAATGFPMEFRHCAAALSWGMHCRVGLEDNLRVRRDAKARSNSELVAVAVDLADLLARPLMTPDQLRATLGPWTETVGAPRQAAESR